MTNANHEIVWIELKHWINGYQQEDKRDAGYYFGIAGSSGIKPDVEKLNSAVGNKYIMVLMTDNPGKWEWSAGVTNFNRKFSPLRIQSLTNPDHFPGYYFLGLLTPKGNEIATKNGQQQFTFPPDGTGTRASAVGRRIRPRMMPTLPRQKPLPL